MTKNIKEINKAIDILNDRKAECDALIENLSIMKEGIDSVELAEEVQQNDRQDGYLIPDASNDVEVVPVTDRTKHEILETIPRLIEVVSRVPIPEDVENSVAIQTSNAEPNIKRQVTHAVYRTGYFDGVADTIHNLQKFQRIGPEPINIDAVNEKLL